MKDERKAESENRKTNHRGIREIRGKTIEAELGEPSAPCLVALRIKGFLFLSAFDLRVSDFSFRWPLDLISVQVWPECRRNADASIGLLIRLHQCHKQPRQSGAAAVQHVREPVLTCCAFETQVHAARLEIFAI